MTVRKRKIPNEVKAEWLLSSMLTEFMSALFLMWGMGSLGHHWGYLHSLWITATLSTAFGVVILPITVRIEYLIER